MIQKPGKSTEFAKSYRPISLLLVLSKLFEKLLLSKIFMIIVSYGLISDHQFDFHSKYATIEQIHRIVKSINNDMETGRYCTTIFRCLAFDKIWHQGLFYKIKNSFRISMPS